MSKAKSNSLDLRMGLCSLKTLRATQARQGTGKKRGLTRAFKNFLSTYYVRGAGATP